MLNPARYTKCMKTLLLSTFTFLIAASLTLSAGDAWADKVSPDARAWAKEVKKAVQSNRVKFDVIDLVQNALSPDEAEQLDVIAEDQAQVWADTILESDYIAENLVQVDLIETVQSGASFLGYRVTYSAKAVDTSECDAARDLSQCHHGRIVESTFVAPKLSSWIRDDQNYAKFVSDDPNRVVEEDHGEPQSAGSRE